MKKIVLGLVLGLGFGAVGIAFASSQQIIKNLNIWDNSYSDHLHYISATAKVDSFNDNNNTCYILQSPASNSSFGVVTNGSPIGISCVKN